MEKRGQELERRIGCKMQLRGPDEKGVGIKLIAEDENNEKTKSSFKLIPDSCGFQLWRTGLTCRKALLAEDSLNIERLCFTFCSGLLD